MLKLVAIRRHSAVLSSPPPLLPASEEGEGGRPERGPNVRLWRAAGSLREPLSLKPLVIDRSRCLPFSPSGLVKPAVDIGDLLHPPLSFGVFEIQDVVPRPMEMVGDVGYLLVQPVEGVALYSPPRLARSNSNSC